MAQRVGFKTWRAALDRFMISDWCLSIDDSGVDDERLMQGFQNGTSPREYSKWFGEKYDLTHTSELQWNFGRLLRRT